MGFPGDSEGKELACNVGDLDLIPGLGRYPEESLAAHSSILAWRISMDRGAWWATVCGVTKSQRLSTVQHREKERSKVRGVCQGPETPECSQCSPSENNWQ